MRTRIAIITLTAATLLTGCGGVNSKMKDSSAVDIIVKVDERELCTTADAEETPCFTAVSTSTHLVETTCTTTAATQDTTTELVTETPTEPEPTDIESITDTLVDGEKVCPVTGIALQYTSAYCICEQPLTARAGVVWYNGHKETYYSENALPGPGLNIPDRHHGDDGTIRDADGYICVAADYGFLPYGSIVVTSLGPGKVYDTGCAWGTIDIYTCW